MGDFIARDMKKLGASCSGTDERGSGKSFGILKMD